MHHLDCASDRRTMFIRKVSLDDHVLDGLLSPSDVRKGKRKENKILCPNICFMGNEWLCVSLEA